MLPQQPHQKVINIIKNEENQHFIACKNPKITQSYIHSEKIPRYLCEHYSVSLSLRATLRKHMQIHHSNKINVYTCDQCKSNHIDNILRHLKIYKKKSAITKTQEYSMREVSPEALEPKKSHRHPESFMLIKPCTWKPPQKSLQNPPCNSHSYINEPCKSCVVLSILE